MRLVTAALIVLAGCGGGSASSPQAVFDTAKKAGESKDWKTFYGCFDPEQSHEILMGMIMVAGFSVMQDKDAEKELNEIFRRHGFDPEKKPASGKEDPKQMMASIKDPAGLFHEVMTFTEKKSKKGEMTKMDIRGDLADLKIDGDKATGNVTMKDGKKTPMHFVRRNGAWYLSSGK